MLPTLPLSAQSAPYSIQHPTLGSEMVISSQPLSAQAGLKILAAGGNAVDAAIAAAAVLAVVEPTNNGIGGDAFALVWDGESLQGINASGCSAQEASVETLYKKYGTRMPDQGWDSVTVPGVVSAWMELSQRIGTLPFPDLLAPAIHYAEQGFHVTPMIAEKWQQESQRLASSATFKHTFTFDGRPPECGERFIQHDLARTLRRIAKSRGRDFYHGETAQYIDKHARLCQAPLRASDLSSHQALWLTEHSIPHIQIANTHVYEMPPNGQGLIALYALSLLRILKIERFALNSSESIHLQIECIKKAFADVMPLIADPRNMQHSHESFLHTDKLKLAAQEISLQKAQNYAHAIPPLDGTAYLTTGDKKGMMVSLIQSNYKGFGSGVVVPQTGIALQNRAAGFSLDGTSASRFAAGRRPFHTILPGFFRTSDGDMAAFGSTGGTFQPQGHVQLVTRMQIYGQNPQATVNAPRFKVEHGMKVTVEPGFSPTLIEQLTKMGHQISPSSGKDDWGFGGMQILLRRQGMYLGGRDFRRDSHIATA